MVTPYFAAQSLSLPAPLAPPTATAELQKVAAFSNFPISLHVNRLNLKRFRCPLQGHDSKGFAMAGIFFWQFSEIPNTGIRHHSLDHGVFPQLYFVRPFFLFIFMVKPFTRPPPYLRFKALFHYGGGGGSLLAF